MTTIFLDLETRSRCDLKQGGGHVYVRDDSTELLCGVAMIVEGTHGAIHLWSPHAVNLRPRTWAVASGHVAKLGFHAEDLSYHYHYTHDVVPDFLAHEVSKGATLVAHNGEGFDRPFLERFGLDPEATWLDTMHRARQYGLPPSLDAIGTLLFELGKDSKGSKVLHLHCQPHKKTGEFIEPSAGVLAVIARYCVRDVLLMAAAYYDEGWDLPHPDDKVRELHCRIDRRGVPIDLVLAKRIYEECQIQKQEWLLKAQEYGLDETTLRSSSALPKWLAARGCHVEDVQKATLERVLVDLDASDVDDKDAIRTAIEARLAFNRVTEGKALAALRKTCPDRRMRGTLVYHGAHTGRFAGRGLQLQNLPAPVAGFTQDAYDRDTPTAAREIARAIGREVAEEDVLASMLRGLVTSEPGRVLCMVDYSQIEARVLLWLAVDEGGLEVFRQGRDIYRATAAGMFGIPYESIDKKSLERTVGKIATLALGYQGGPAALQAFGAAYGFDFAAAELDEAEVTNKWRDANTLIAGTRKGIWRTPQGVSVVTRQGGLWKGVQRAAIRAVTHGETVEAGRCVFEMHGDHLFITLPSGRPLVYRNMTYELHENQFGEARKALVFDSVRFGKVVREATYGGRLTENLTQAVSRDLMTDAMLELEAEGLHTLFSVHDELIVSAPDEGHLALVEEIMTRVPSWAFGLPLAAEGEVGTRYRK